MEFSAASVSSRLPHVSWHVEDNPSREYVLSLLLVFVDERRPEDELVVVAVNVDRASDPRWTIDATGHLGTLIAEETELTASDQAEMLVNPSASSARVEAFLTAV
jgi:hypothetical protein